MIKFYCKCGKEMWQYANWDNIKSWTLEEAQALLICSDCLLEETRKLYPSCPECGARLGHHFGCKYEDTDIKILERENGTH